MTTGFEHGPDLIDMYQLPGRPVLDPQTDFQRYLQSSYRLMLEQSVDRELRRVVRDIAATANGEQPSIISRFQGSSIPQIRRTAVMMGRTSLLNAQTETPRDRNVRRQQIVRGLSDPDIDVQIAAAESLYGPLGNIEYSELLGVVTETSQSLLKSSDRITRASAAQIAGFGTRDQIPELIHDGLADSSSNVQIAFAKIIYEAPEDSIEELILEGLENDNVLVERAVAASASHASQMYGRDKFYYPVLNRIYKYLQSPDPELRMRAIHLASGHSRKVTIEACLDDPSIDVRMAAIDSIGSIGSIESTVRKAMENSDPSVAIATARRLLQSNVSQRVFKEARLIIKDKIMELAFSSDPEIALDAMEIASYTGEPIDKEFVQRGLNDGDLQMRVRAAKLLEGLEVEESLQEAAIQAIMGGLNSGDEKLQMLSIQAIPSIHVDRRMEILRHAKTIGIADLCIRPALYAYSPKVSRKEFGREAFEKTGSRTTLLGGGLYQKIVLRQILKEPFLAWKSLYENLELWRNNGFDYVPIEPIVSFRSTGNDVVSVATGVLDLDLNTWLKISGNKFMDELEQLKSRILRAHSIAGFAHMHVHDGNFCLSFFRDENGQPDFDRMPRLYLIDFDNVLQR